MDKKPLAARILAAILSVSLATPGLGQVVPRGGFFAPAGAPVTAVFTRFQGWLGSPDGEALLHSLAVNGPELGLGGADSLLTQLQGLDLSGMAGRRALTPLARELSEADLLKLARIEHLDTGEREWLLKQLKYASGRAAAEVQAQAGPVLKRALVDRDLPQEELEKLASELKSLSVYGGIDSQLSAVAALAAEGKVERAAKRLSRLAPSADGSGLFESRPRPGDPRLPVVSRDRIREDPALTRKKMVVVFESGRIRGHKELVDFLDKHGLGRDYIGSPSYFHAEIRLPRGTDPVAAVRRAARDGRVRSVNVHPGVARQALRESGRETRTSAAGGAIPSLVDAMFVVEGLAAIGREAEALAKRRGIDEGNLRTSAAIALAREAALLWASGVDAPTSAALTATLAIHRAMLRVVDSGGRIKDVLEDPVIAKGLGAIHAAVLQAYYRPGGRIADLAQAVERIADQAVTERRAARIGTVSPMGILRAAASFALSLPMALFGIVLVTLGRSPKALALSVRTILASPDAKFPLKAVLLVVGLPMAVPFLGLLARPLAAAFRAARDGAAVGMRDGLAAALRRIDDEVGLVDIEFRAMERLSERRLAKMGEGSATRLLAALYFPALVAGSFGMARAFDPAALLLAGPALSVEVVAGMRAFAAFFAGLGRGPRPGPSGPAPAGSKGVITMDMMQALFLAAGIAISVFIIAANSIVVLNATLAGGCGLIGLALTAGLGEVVGEIFFPKADREAIVAWTGLAGFVAGAGFALRTLL